MKNKLKYIGISVFIGLLGILFISAQTLPVAKNKEIKGIKWTNDEGLNPYIHYDYITFGSIKELNAASNSIIKGEVISVHSPEAMTIGIINKGTASEKPMKAVFTVSDVRVIESLKGTLKPGDVIQVRQLGGSYKGIDYPTDYPEIYTPNMQGIFFLLTHDKGPADHVNPCQGFVKLVNGKYEKQQYKANGNYVIGIAKDTHNILFENGMDENNLKDLIKN